MKRKNDEEGRRWVEVERCLKGWRRKRKRNRRLARRIEAENRARNEAEVRERAAIDTAWAEKVDAYRRARKAVTS